VSTRCHRRCTGPWRAIMGELTRSSSQTRPPLQEARTSRSRMVPYSAHYHTQSRLGARGRIQLPSVRILCGMSGQSIRNRQQPRKLCPCSWKPCSSKSACPHSRVRRLPQNYPTGRVCRLL
jgi:hypothetical protein